MGCNPLTIITTTPDLRANCAKRKLQVTKIKVTLDRGTPRYCAVEGCKVGRFHECAL